MFPTLDRYLDLVDDRQAFLEACQRPLPRVVWANPLLAPIEQTADLVRQFCPDAQPIDYHPGAWRLPPDSNPGRWLPYQLGLLHGQEEAALWVVSVLDPQPHEDVLDLCASPGNKTAQIAIAMGDRGRVVANEKKRGRLTSLSHNVQRLGLSSVVMTWSDGVRFGTPVPKRTRDAEPPPTDLSPFTLFDRVLVDAPCSCEGTTRKTSALKRALPDDEREVMVQQQKALLRRAINLTRPGGVVVYSTCTFAPEENEFVVSCVDQTRAELEQVVAPAGVRTAPGIREWKGRTFRDDIEKTVRLWPHQNDTGGFYVARFRRL